MRVVAKQCQGPYDSSVGVDVRFIFPHIEETAHRVLILDVTMYVCVYICICLWNYCM